MGENIWLWNQNKAIGKKKLEKIKMQPMHANIFQVYESIQEEIMLLEQYNQSNPSNNSPYVFFFLLQNRQRVAIEQ